jgi:RHS repeat-associated protein
VTKRYFYDINGSVVAEYEANGGTGYGALKRLNVCAAGGRLLAVDEVQTDGSKVTSYVMADRIGSTRALMNAAGAVTSRHDYFPFGEEIGAGTGAPGSPAGMRTAAQGYSAADNVRDRYAETRLDDATGLDHTLWRKLETRSGRWTTPDPYGKSLRVANPQSFNRYAYVHNDPVNFVDRSGLDELDDWVPGPGDILYTNTLDRVPNGGGWLFGDDPGNPLPIVDPFTKKPTGGGGIDPQKPVPLPGTEAINDRLNTGDCNAYIGSLLAKASELYGGQGNVAVAKDGLDLLNKISGFVLKDFLEISGYPVGGTVTGSIAGNNTFAAGSATVVISTRFMYGSDPATIAMWQANYVNTAIHEMLHLAGRYSGYDDTQLATAASRLPGAGSGLPAPPGTNQDMNGTLNNSGYYNSELMKHCGAK